MKLVIGNEQTPRQKTPIKGELVYHILAVLVLAGLLLTLVALGVALAGHANWPSIAGVLATFAAYGAIVFYCMRGFRETDKRYYRIAIYCVTAMLFFKSLVPLHTMLSEALLTAAFGLLLVFAERLDKPVQAKKIMFAALVILAAEMLTVLFMPLDTQLTSLQAFVVRAMPLSSLLLTGVLAYVYSNDISR